MSKISFHLPLTSVIAIICIVLFSFMIFIPDFDAIEIGKCFTIIMYIGVGFSSLTIVLFNGLRFILFLIIISVCTDIFAYVFGMAFGRHGRHKLAPKISPKKSWEGAIGGTLVASIVGFLFGNLYHLFGHYFVTDPTPIRFFDSVFDYAQMNEVAIGFIIFFLSVALSIFSQIGDLIASRLKRTYDIKDFSQVMPGHGGILDRFDSLLFASIVFLAFITIIRVLFPII